MWTWEDVLVENVLAKKTSQGELRREYEQWHIVQGLKDIFVDTCDIKYIDEKIPIRDQLVHIFEKINDYDIDVNEKLLHLSENFF